MLAIWNGVTPEAEAEFVAWHVREHIPERVGLPGFLRGRRYVALDGHPKYFNFYETARLEDLSSPAYLACLDAPSPWTRAVVAHFTETSRTICKVVTSEGRGDGAIIETVELRTTLSADEFRRSIADKVAPALLALPGIVGLHLLQGDDAASNLQTAEKKLRERADAIADWILLIEAADPEHLQTARAGTASSASLVAAGAASGMRRGIYRLQYALSSAQLEQAGARSLETGR